MGAVDPIAKLVIARMGKITQAQLGKSAGVSRYKICRWFSGERPLRVDEACKVMEVLGLVVTTQEVARAGTILLKPRTTSRRD